MRTTRYQPKLIMTLLRQVEVVIAHGKLTLQACREAGISESCHILCYAARGPSGPRNERYPS
ncbi:MAG: hypothetical protein ACLQBA_01165 [Candidatus Binataceae bacterium]